MRIADFWVILKHENSSQFESNFVEIAYFFSSLHQQSFCKILNGSELQPRDANRASWPLVYPT